MANLRLPMLTLNLLRSHQHLVSPTWSQNHDLPRTAKDFPNVSAPSAKRGDSVKFVRPYATPTKKLNLRFFGYFLLNYGVRRGLGEKGER